MYRTRSVRVARSRRLSRYLHRTGEYRPIRRRKASDFTNARTFAVGSRHQHRKVRVVRRGRHKRV